jgi:DNA-binding NtrC family response regulator
MPKSTYSVLFVDDDPDVKKTAEFPLRKAGYEFYSAASPAEAISHLVSNKIDIVLLDLNFSKGQTTGEEGLECLRNILRRDPGAIVIVVTGHCGQSIAIEAVRTGAADFVMKPWNNERLLQTIENALASRRRGTLDADDPSILVGETEVMKRVLAAVDRCAPLHIPVLLTGETGTGKTLAAKIIHRQSGRTNLTVVDAGALTISDLDDNPDKTLLLENVDRLEPRNVPHLVNWIYAAPRRNSRLISTTTKLRAQVSADPGLTYAISRLDFAMPPLRDRRDDIVLLAEHFIRVRCRQLNIRIMRLAPEAKTLLSVQTWPDNIHELRCSVDNSVSNTEGEVISRTELELDSRLSLDCRR